MATSWVEGNGGARVGGSATVTFASTSGKVDADVEVLWDFDNDGDFDETVEDITGFVIDLETQLGRDWPSLIHGSVGPGRLRMTLDNSDDRFSLFNEDSPLTADPFSLDVGRKLRVQTTGASNPDPTLIVRDRFDRADTESGDLGVAETGQAWTPRTFSDMHIVDGEAVAFTEGATHTYTIDVGAADYYVQVTVTNPFDQVDASGAFSPPQTNGDAGIVFRWQDASNYQLFRVFPHADSGDGFMEFEVVNVVAGALSVVDSGFFDVIRKDVTMGVRVSGSVYGAYVEGGNVYTGTALQLDETEVGIHCNYGTDNSQPRFDDFYVWDRMREALEGILWTGTITDVQPSVQLGPRKLVTVNAEGVFTDLAARNVQPQPRPIAWGTGYSIGEALVKAGQALPPPRATTIDDLFYGLAYGDQLIGAVGYGSDGISALEHCRKVEAVELGFFHETPEGWASFHARSERDAQSVQAAFSDAPGAQFGYSEIELLDSKRELVNHVKVGVSARSPNIVRAVAHSSVSGAGAANPVTVTLPATNINEGDLMVFFFVSTVRNANENWLVPIWWQRLRDTGGSVTPRMQVYAHVCDGTEESSQVTFYSDAGSAGGAWIGLMWQIRNWYGVIDDGVQLGDPARGNSSAGANPAPLLPRWGVTNATLFLAQRTAGNVSGSGDGSVSNPTYPLGYILANSSLQEGTGSDAFDCAEQHCIRDAITTIEDPTGFTGFSGLGNSEANLVAVRAYNGDPPEQNGRYVLEFNDTGSQARVGGIRTHEGPTLFASEDDAEEYAELVLDRYAVDRPIVRITFPALINASYRGQAVRRRVGQKIHLTANGQTGAGIDGDFVIENIGHRLSHAGKEWRVTWELSPA